jgi:hypothetical protein
VPVSVNRTENGNPRGDQGLEGFDIAEEELIDAYVRGQLSLADRTLLEKGLRSSPQLVERLHFARLLADAADRAAEDELALPREQAAPSPRAWFPFGLTWGRPAFNLAFAACALIIFIGVAGLFASWLRVRRESQQLTDQQASLERQKLELQKSAAEQRLATDQLTAELKEKQQKLEADQQRLDELTQALNQKPLTSSAATATLFLLPTSRSSGNERELKLAPETSKISLQLAVSSIDYHAFVAEVKNSQQQEISRLKVSAPRSGKPVSVTIPSKLLPPGAYSLQLSGVLPDGTNESVGNYGFRITRK